MSTISTIEMLQDTLVLCLLKRKSRDLSERVERTLATVSNTGLQAASGQPNATNEKPLYSKGAVKHRNLAG
jgi:hypothetical protein